VGFLRALSPNYPGEGAATFVILSRRKLVRVSDTVPIANQEKARHGRLRHDEEGAVSPMIQVPLFLDAHAVRMNWLAW